MKLRQTPTRIAIRKQRLSGQLSSPHSPHNLPNTELAAMAPAAKPSLVEPPTPPPSTPRNVPNSIAPNDYAKSAHPNVSASPPAVATSVISTDQTPSRAPIDYFYTFFARKNKPELQKLAQSQSLTKKGKKNELVARLVLTAKKYSLNGNDSESWLSSESHIEAFRLMPDSILVVESCPVEDELLNQLGQRERDLWTTELHRIRNNVGTPAGGPQLRAIPGEDGSPESVPHFSLDEFARLIVVLRDDDTAKRAIKRAVGSQLNRLELEDKVSRDDFYEVIANRFNDPTLLTRETLFSTLDHVDPAKPVVVNRSAAQLKRHYQEAKKDFTYFFDKWSASGQNDPERFLDFLLKHPDGSFMTASARSLILFKLLRCGTVDEDTELVHVFSKVMEEDVLFEAELHGEDDGRGDGVVSRKKKRRSNDSVIIEQKLERLVDITTSSVMESQKERSMFDGTVIQKQIDVLRTEINHYVERGASAEIVREMQEFVDGASRDLFRKVRQHVTKMLKDD